MKHKTLTEPTMKHKTVTIRPKRNGYFLQCEGGTAVEYAKTKLDALVNAFDKNPELGPAIAEPIRMTHRQAVELFVFGIKPQKI